MKKLILITAFFLLSGMAFGQTLKKGNLIGFHSWKPVLAEGVTMDQYIKFIKEKICPAYEKNEPGLKCFVLTAKRGECADCVGFMFVFPTEQDRNKYHNEDGTNTELLNKAMTKLQPLIDEWQKMESAPDAYTDWIVQ
jgi:hypothetical protein